MPHLALSRKIRPRRPIVLGVALVASWAAAGPAGGDGPPAGTVTVDLGRVVNRFTGNAPLGAAVDGHSSGEIAQIYTRGNLAAMRSAGYAQLTYRLRTELGAEAWHWNPRGHWSDPRHRRGYWVSDPGGPRYAVSYGYRLPRRGNTIDQANDDGYSRLDDGNPRTFWKSDPYLDPRPQWVQVDLGAIRAVDGARLEWAQPYARRVRVQYWIPAREGPLPPWRNGAELENEVFAAGGPGGAWHDFPLEPGSGHGGTQRLRLAGTPIQARYLRVLLSRSSHTAVGGSRVGGPRSADVRDRLGFALDELRFGRLTSDQTLVDYVRHAPTKRRQSIVWVSSTDPWHRASDLDRGYQQPSFDTVFASGLAMRRPVLAPVATVYGNPADAANELRFLRARHYPLSGVELGEEPDGQLIGPEDYATLYARFARALRRVDPHVRLGGPSLSTAIPDWTVAPNAQGATSWTGRFVAELRRRRALSELGFFSFEWYPFDDVCADPATQLPQAPGLLAAVIARQRRAGLPARVPLEITEYGFSAFAAQAEVSLSGALLDADVAARVLALGGRSAFLYGLEPDAVMRESRRCPAYGNLVLFQSDDRHRIRRPVAALYAERLLGRRWLAPDAGAERMYATASDVIDGAGREVVSGYAVQRANGQMSLLLVNRDPAVAHTVDVHLLGPSAAGELAGPAEVLQYSPAQYAWRPRGLHGYAAPDRPPVQFALGAGPVRLSLPASSLTVVVTRGPAASARGQPPRSVS